MDAAAVATRVRQPSRTNVVGSTNRASVWLSHNGGFGFDLLSFRRHKGTGPGRCHILHPYLRSLKTGMMVMSAPFSGSGTLVIAFIPRMLVHFALTVHGPSFPC